METNYRRSLRDRLSFVWKFAKPYMWTIVSSEVIQLAGYVFEIIKPLILAAIVDEGFLHLNVSFFYKCLAIYAIIFIGGNLLMLLYSYTWLRIVNSYVYDIRRNLFENIVYAKATYMDNMKVGDIIERIDDNAGEMIFVLIRNILHFVNQIIGFIMTSAVIYMINPSLSFFVMLLIPVAATISGFLGNRSERLSRQRVEQHGLFTGRIYEYVRGMRDIRVFQAEKYIKTKISKSFVSLLRLDIKMSWIEYGVEKGNSFVNLFATLCLFGFCIYLVLNDRLTVGLFLAVFQFYINTQGNINWLAENYVQWQQRKVYIDRANEILSMKTERDDDRSKSVEITNGNVDFRNVEFSYEAGRPVLRNVSFSIRSGERVAIVGASGSGKTTIAHLLVGLYAPQNGIILIDDQDISSCTYSSLRENVKIVSQNVVLYKKTIRDNLLVGNEYATQDKLWDALEKSGAKDFVQSLPGGLDTMVGTQGFELSGGQAQRILFARIILKNPKILIMDEATSSLDYEAENLINNVLESRRIGHTVLVIAHRLHTILNSDRVIVIKDGMITATGTHDNLIKSSEHYRELFENHYLVSE